MIANMKTKSVLLQAIYNKEDYECPKKSPGKDELPDNYTTTRFQISRRIPDVDMCEKIRNGKSFFVERVETFRYRDPSGGIRPRRRLI